MYFLGISAYYHDLSITLLDVNGNLIDFKKEEWLSRIKGDKSFPRQSLEELVKNYNLSYKNLASVIFYEKPVRAWLTVLKHSIKHNSLKNELTRNYFKNVWNSSIRFQMDLSKYLDLKKISISYAEHHLSHTLSTLFYYNEKPCVSLVIDGYGDRYCSSIHHVKSEKEIINIWTSEYPNSLGLFYSAITDFLGFAVNEGEYKMMGLASYGQPKYYEALQETISFEDNKLTVDTRYYDYVRSTNRSYSNLLAQKLKLQPRNSIDQLEVGEESFKNYANLAASAQKLLEDILFKIFEYAYYKTGEKNFLFSGGVAMNSSAVRKISQLKFIEKLNIPPSPGDSGASLGAAYYGLIKFQEKILPKENLLNNLFPGKTKFNDEFYSLVFEKVAEIDNSIEKTAKIISENEIVATCYSNIETGPRALGHRSLICNAHNSGLIKTLNTKIKKRNLYRPTAPAMLESSAAEFFYLDPKLMNCYYHMAATASPKEDVVKNISGVVHVDNTSRIQICEENSLLGQILRNLINYNIKLIANTSFNISSDPMVYDKTDALIAVERMGIKYLLTETGLYKKK